MARCAPSSCRCRRPCPMEPSARIDARSALKGARVLIVEDDFLILLELESVLAEAGGELAGSCLSLEEGLAGAENGDLTAAVLDVRLGRESSFPIAHRLERRGVPFVFYTGQAEIDQLRAQWPECRVIAKPARRGAIVAAIA